MLRCFLAKKSLNWTNLLEFLKIKSLFIGFWLFRLLWVYNQRLFRSVIMENKLTEAQEFVWKGAIPLLIQLHESEVTTVPPPPPALVFPQLYILYFWLWCFDCPSCFNRSNNEFWFAYGFCDRFCCCFSRLLLSIVKFDGFNWLCFELILVSLYSFVIRQVIFVIFMNS